MCDSCSEISDILATCDPDIAWGPKKRLSKSEIVTVCSYVQGWGQRQCMCIYKDPRNYDRFNHLIQGVLWATLELIRSMETGKPPALTMFVRVSESEDGISEDNKSDGKKAKNEKKTLEIVEITELDEEKKSKEVPSEGATKSPPPSVLANAMPNSKPILNWTLEEKEHLLQFATKEISQQEATILSVHCDINDPEIPIHLLRNVCFFCDHDVLLAMVACFINATPEVLPFSLARAMISIVSNLKLWMNVAAVIKYLVPLRSSVIRYMCKLSDKDLRSAGTRSMSEFMWTAVKDPLDSHMSFDREGLDLAFKYFTSSTLTMRLAGIAYINNHVTIYNELANSENAVETEVLGLGLSDWLINNRIVENIFGPNLHVEIIKQSHIALNFLAMEGCITNEHVDSMWSAAQLKHCSKQVHDLLLPLIKHLEPGPVVHLYSLLCRLEPQEHSEQTLYLTSALLKVLWSNENVHQNHLALGCEQSRLQRHVSPFTSVLKGSIADIARGSCKGSRHEASSSERSISLDSDEEATEARGEIVDPLALHIVKNCNESGPSDPGSAPSDVAQLHNWPDEQNSFTSSDNESDVGDDHLIGPHLPMSVASSDSDGRAGEGDDSGSENEAAEPVRRRRPRSLLNRQHQRRMLLMRRRRAPGTQHLSADLSELRNTVESVVEGKDVQPLSEEKRAELDETKGFVPTMECDPNANIDSDVVTPPKKRRENSPNNNEEIRGKKLPQTPRVNPDVAVYSQLDGKAYECMEYFEQIQSQRLQHPESDLMDDIMSPDEGTCSSRMSTKSEKNMADFEGEESGCEEELIQLTGVQVHLASPHHINKMTSLYCSQVQNAGKGSHSGPQKGVGTFISPCMDIESVCRPGQTLLWDLLQDETVVKLGKGLALEAEKVLSNLVCWSTDRIIRMKFIEGCLQNLANNKSIYLSLRLLPRLFGSFQQYRGRMDTHTITMWAEKDHHMMELFFKNLLAYTNQIRSGQTLPNTLYSHPLEVQVRLQFLTCIFSAGGSPDYFRLSLDQVDALWSCLANDPETADELFSWLLTQAKNKEQHALGIDALKHIFTEKLPLLQPETTSMTALNLIQQLSNITKLSEDGEQNRERGLSGMDQLWGIALRAQSTDVSMTAIQYLNTYYINGHPRTLEREEEFIQRCMTSLTSVLSNLEQMALFNELSRNPVLCHCHEIHIISFVLISIAKYSCTQYNVIQTILPKLKPHLLCLHIHSSEKQHKCEELSLVVVQRALLLLKTHLETFQRRYAYHLRMWHLEGHGICSHQRPLVDRQIPPIRVVVQPAGISEKVILELLNTDYVADLRAEVAHWWEHFQQQHRTQPRHQDTETSQDGSTCSSSISGDSSSAHQDTPQSAPSPPSGVTPILGAMLTDGPIRVITQGQELTTDLDERTIGELGFKDMQLVFVSVGAQRPLRKREELEPASVLPPPPREKLPAMLLLQPNYLEQLFRLIQQLGELKAVGRGGSLIPHTKGHLLSWRVWEILMMMPTCPQVLTALRSLEDKMCASNSPGNGLSTLLDPQTPHKLMYSLQIVESLARTERPHIAYNPSANDRESNSQNNKSGRHLQDANMKSTQQNSSWAKQFVEKGGLQHLFDIFMSGILQVQDQGIWSEWNQDCLAYLLKLIYQLGLETLENDTVSQPLSISDSLAALTSMTSASGTSVPSSSAVPRRKSKKQKKGAAERLTLPKLNKVMLTMMSDVASVTQRIVSILYDAGRLRDSAHYKIGVGGRGQVVHFAMSFLLSWALSCGAVKSVLFGDPHMTGWLHHLLLDDPEPSVRQEVCSSLYRLCLGSTSEGQTGQAFVVPLLKCLIGFLHSAKNMKPSRYELYSDGDKDKEPYGPACREYFWLVCRLFDSLDDEFVKENANSNDLRLQLDLDGMAHQLAASILSREFLETRQNNVEDDGLFGLLNLCSAVIKHNPAFKYVKEGQEFLVHIFDCLFALPSPKHRHFPLCKSQLSRSAAYDLLVELSKGCYENYCILHAKLMQQHSPNSHAPYPWDYWPHEDGRSDCGYVGLTNLGATCYMASCMQHLYMMPQARASILSAKCSLESKHETTLVELQRMFAYLLESERKAYNPRSFCKVYTMDHQPLNTGEQKDMAEFFTDLISKLEEMTPQLKVLVKTLFCGVITNNVVSLDCPHVSRTIEEFYTVRCQVADMRNLYESLDEVTVKDTLEGDNMYTCSQCGRKVRAEKRACLKKLPRILCFNTMRYTFNMVTMMKEKVNTHFSFPLRLDMSKYTERVLMPDQYKEMKDDEDGEGKDEYDLIGITVHTGTADGGHYYSFIRDRTALNKDKWFLFNDAEVKPFDPTQIAAECFGGEMTSKTYDSVTDKFMDFSFEKTHSAYMLFYERAASSCFTTRSDTSITSSPLQKPSASTVLESPPSPPSLSNHTLELPKDLANWIWEDNMQFLQDKNIFEHTYFNFMWQICGYVPQTLMQHKDVNHVTLLAAKLSTSFVLETLIHAKEKPTMVQWIELLTKLFNSSQNACEWFLEHMAEHDWWPVQILIRCPNQVVRQMFQRLCIHVINKLRPHSVQKSNHGSGESGDSNDGDSIQSICMTCVARFIKKLLSLIEHGANQHTRHLTEYFAFLLEFAKMSSRECQFLLSIESISTIVNFYLGHKAGDYVDPVSDEEEEEVDDVLSLNEDKYKPASLEKMITLIATLVEKSRGDDHHLHLSANDYNAITGGKGFPFLYQQIRDNVNIRQTCNLVFSLSRWNEPLAVHVVSMIFQSISQHPEQSQPFFKLLSMLVEFVGGPPGMPAFTRLILQHIWEVAEACPQQCLEWLSLQVPRNKFAHSWVLQNMDSWVEHFLISHTNQRVRNAAAHLLVSLIPSSHFKQAFRNARNMLSPQKDISMSPDATMVLHHIYDLLLRLLKRAKHYVDVSAHGTTKLMSYFALMTYCLVSHAEKLMFGQYFMDLWQLFQPKLSEPPIAVHHNKQALLIFWYHVCIDCPENVKLIVQNAHVTKNIAFNYILADHEDQDVMIFNRYMLPAYYGLLRLCCQQSRPFTRQLANHQNIQWAFKNITPYPAQYPAAVDELYKLMRLFVAKYPDSSEQELKEVESFKCTTFLLYLSVLDGRSCWATLVAICRILIDCNDNRLFLVCNNGMPMLFEAFQTLHVMYHEATACHVTGELVELLSIILDILKCVRSFREGKGIKQFVCAWKERPDTIRKLLTLLNSYAPSNLRQASIEVLRELVMQYPVDCLQTMVPIMTHSHSACQENAVPVPSGPYFPRRGQKLMESKAATRPPNPFLQMTLHPNQLEISKGHDPEYDQALHDYFSSYHGLLDMMCRLAVNHDLMSESLVNLSAAVGTEGIPLHLIYFPKLWIDVHDVKHVDKKYMDMLCSSFFFVDYVDRVLALERRSLVIPVVFQFMRLYMPKIASHFMGERAHGLVNCIVESLEASTRQAAELENEAATMNGDLLALKLLCLVDCPLLQRSTLISYLDKIMQKCCDARKAAVSVASTASSDDKKTDAAKGAAVPPLQSEAESSTQQQSVDAAPAAEDNLPTKRLKTDKPESNDGSLPSSSNFTQQTPKESASSDSAGRSQQIELVRPDLIELLSKTAASLMAMLQTPPITSASSSTAS